MISLSDIIVKQWLAGWLTMISRIFVIGVSVQRVVDDVGLGVVIILFRGDDVFVVVALPDRDAGGGAELVDAYSNRGFKAADECAQRFWHGSRPFFNNRAISRGDRPVARTN